MRRAEAPPRSVATTVGVCIFLFAHATSAGSIVHVTKAGSPIPTGEASAPFHLVEAGVVKTQTSGANTVQVAAGAYYETLTIDTPCTLTATGGSAVIGKQDYQASTTVEIITLNTHLAGDEIFFQIVGNTWRDYERADDIAEFFGGPNPEPDVVGFQEIWDEDLFIGGDGANGILPTSGYPHGGHGDDEMGLVLNSGLAIMSHYPLAGFLQVKYNATSGFFEPLAAKGWVQATIVKDGFSIRLYNTHAQADDTAGDKEARASQIAQLRNEIISYRASNPDHVVFAMGDFNVYGEESEYYAELITRMGDQAGGKDADPNSPGYVYGASEQQTLCDCNRLAKHFDDNTRSGRLDYIFYFSSQDGSVEVLPGAVDVLQFIGDEHSDDGLTTNQSSDHWGVHGQFRLIRP